MVEGYGILPDTVSGSSSTHLPDGVWWNSSVVGFARFGGSSFNGLLCGSFALNVNNVVSIVNIEYGVSLTC